MVTPTTPNTLHALVWQEGKWFIAKTLEIELASQGTTQKEALDNLREAVELFFENEKSPLPQPVSNPQLLVFHPRLASYA